MASEITIGLRELVLYEELLVQVDVEDSQLSEYLDKLSFLFILQNLEGRAKMEFIDMLSEPGSGKAAVAYAKARIDKFNDKLRQYLENKIMTLIEKSRKKK